MKIENLHEGQIFKNYNDLCATLEIKAKRGNSKNAQVKEMNTLFSHHKEGNKIVIDEIFDEQKIKEDGRNGGYCEMRNLILRLLLLSNQEENRAVFPTSTLLREINAVNCNYATGRRKQEELSKYLDIGIENVNEFYNSTHSNLKRALETNLNKLMSQRLIFWDNTVMVCKNTSHNVVTNDLGELEIDEEGHIVANVTQDFREATCEEKEIILDSERKVLLELKCNDVHEVFKRGLADEYYKRVYGIVRKRSNISFYFLAYSIIFIRDTVRKEVEKIDTTYELERHLLNESVRKRVYTNAEKRKNKAELSEDDEGYAPIRKLDDYMENVSKLISSVIDSSAENIVKELKELESK